MDESLNVVVTKDNKTAEQWVQELTTACREVVRHAPPGHLAIMIPLDEENKAVRVAPISRRASPLFDETR